jgi:hypothetical protein
MGADARKTNKGATAKDILWELMSFKNAKVQ